MDIRHKLGGDMNILLNGDDIENYGERGVLTNRVDVEGVSLRTELIRDPDLVEPVAQTDGHSVTVFLPDNAKLPFEIEVWRSNPAADFYFGKTGKIIVNAVVELKSTQ